MISYGNFPMRPQSAIRRGSRDGGSGASRNMVPGGAREFPLLRPQGVCLQPVRKRQSPKSRQRALSSLRGASIFRITCCSCERQATRSRSYANISIPCVRLKRWTHGFLVLNRDDTLARNRSAMTVESSPSVTPPMKERRPLRRKRNDHNFRSLLMLAITDRA